MSFVKFKPSPLTIICGIDSGYAPHLAVMLASLASTNPDRPIECHVLCDAVDDSIRTRVESSCSPVKVFWYDVVSHKVLDFKPLLQISRATYLRLMMLEILPTTIKRAIYLDVDMVVNGDLDQLWNTELEGKVCGAVVDPGVEANEFAKRWSLPLPGQYFNAGMLLIDMDRLRSKPFLQEAIAILDDPTKHCEFADQDALNIALWNEWLPVDPSWNFQRKFLYEDYASWKQLDPVRREPRIIHYTERFKPWNRSEWHPYAWLYLKNLSRTSFKDEVLKSGQIGLLDRCKWRLRYMLRTGKCEAMY